MIKIKLTKKQGKKLQPLLVMAATEYEKGKAGIILAQVGETGMDVVFVDHEASAKIIKLLNPTNYSMLIAMGIIQEEALK